MLSRLAGDSARYPAEVSELPVLLRGGTMIIKNGMVLSSAASIGRALHSSTRERERERERAVSPRLRHCAREYSCSQVHIRETRTNERNYEQ